MVDVIGKSPYPQNRLNYMIAEPVVRRLFYHQDTRRAALMIQIGVSGLIIGLIPFFQALFAGKLSSNVATVRVSAIVNGAGGASNADGDVAQVRLYNVNQQIIGNAPGGYVGSGGFKDVHISQTNSQQAVYAQIEAGNNAICIPYITMTWVDGQQLGFSGDFGKTCGLDWYYGNVYVASGKQPTCTWIDKDHTNNIKAGMIMINFPSFEWDSRGSNQANTYCGYPEFRAYTNTGGSSIFRRSTAESSPNPDFEALALPLTSRAPSSATTLARSVVKVKRKVDNRLVISPFEGHNATELCASPTSRGPDFVSLVEGVYCDMQTSETLPLCGRNGVKDGCFDVGTKSKVAPAGARVATASLAKGYERVWAW